MRAMKLTSKRLKEVLHYDSETGVFTWLVRRNGAGGPRNPGDRAGGLIKVGYEAIGVDGTRYYTHRLAWLYMKGKWPDSTIDHIDGDRLNNRFANLRDVLRKTNNQNLKAAQRNNSSGLLGVQKNGRDGWMARCE